MAFIDTIIERAKADKKTIVLPESMDKNPNAAPTDFMKLAEIYVNKAKKDPAKKIENIDKGLWHASEEGTPQGGPLSPLLSNIMLNELDKELARRGHPFVRYADFL